MSWVAVGGTAIGLAGSWLSSDKQADAAKKGGQAAQAAQDLAYNRNQANMQPYLDAGTTALGQLGALNSGDYSGFLNSPDYLATQQSGLQALDRSAAARGALNSGGADADRIAFGANLGAQQLGSFRSGLMGLAGLGQTAAANLSGVNSAYANNTGNIAQGVAGAQGDAASAQIGAGTGFLNTLLSQYAGTTGNTRSSSYQPGTWGTSVTASPDSLYNFGNNMPVGGSW